MKFASQFIAIIFLSMFVIVSHPNDFNNIDDLNPIIGAVEFEQSCAICHGFDGKGKGIMSDSLTKTPADLTILTKNNNGYFPFTQIYEVIEGSTQAGSHGSRDMPLWGDRYRKEAQKYNQAAEKYGGEASKYKVDEYLYARGLILELMVHIMNIQEE